MLVRGWYDYPYKGWGGWVIDPLACRWLYKRMAAQGRCSQNCRIDQSIYFTLVKPLSAFTFWQLNPLPFPSLFLEIHSTSCRKIEVSHKFSSTSWMSTCCCIKAWGSWQWLLPNILSQLLGAIFKGPHLVEVSVLLFLPFSNVPSAWLMACS